MNFTTFLTEASIQINKSMENFADEVIKKLYELIDSHVTYNYFEKKLDKKEIYSGEIQSKFSDKEVKVNLNIKDDDHNWAHNNVIWLTISEDLYNDFKKGGNKFKNIRRSVLHELIHIIDPKLNNPELKEKSYKVIKSFTDDVEKLKKIIIYSKDFDEKQNAKNKLVKIFKEYYKFPWELDAYISTEAEEVFKDIKKKSRSKKDALNYLKNYTPENSLLKLYHEDPKVWKRFILSINKLIDRDFQ